jgi:hypothetical protein
MKLDSDEIRLLIEDIREVETLLLSSTRGAIPPETARALHRRSVLRLKLERELKTLGTTTRTRARAQSST